MERMNVEYPSLGEKASAIIKNLFNRMGLVKPGLAVQRAPVFLARFAGRNVQARNAFLALEDSGAELSGNAGWNLACAEIRLGNREGALRALQGCMRTEYRTKTELRQAITLLSQSGGSQPLPLPEIQTAAPTGPALLAGLPASPTECRIELLRRILIPKKVPNRYRPDMTVSLSRNDRLQVSRVLEDVHATAPDAALALLEPLVEAHSKCYTLKVHAAWFAIQSGKLSAAEQHLTNAQGDRPLDPTSLWNLAVLKLQRGDYLSVAKVLELGENLPSLNTHRFWLGLALARAAGRHGNAGAAATRAIEIAEGGPEAGMVKNGIRQTSIQPTPVVREDPVLAAAKAADEYLTNGDPKLAEARIVAAIGADLPNVPRDRAQRF
jgi:tetratricopeptide (TPR) repeat protein